MKLTKNQKDRLKYYDWDAVEGDNGENCSWISITPENGVIFQECVDVFGLTGDEEDIKLLVIGTKEGDD
jgi:hypothetical protein